MKALLSIKPEFVEEIIEGRKKFEYRKKVFKRPLKIGIVVLLFRLKCLKSTKNILIYQNLIPQ